MINLLLILCIKRADYYIFCRYPSFLRLQRITGIIFVVYLKSSPIPQISLLGKGFSNHNRDASMMLMFLWSSHIIVITLVYNSRSSRLKTSFFFSTISTKSPGVLLLCYHTYQPSTISMSHKKTCRTITIVRD